jgi:hypothetical protein
VVQRIVPHLCSTVNKSCFSCFFPVFPSFSICLVTILLGRHVLFFNSEFLLSFTNSVSTSVYFPYILTLQPHFHIGPVLYTCRCRFMFWLITLSTLEGLCARWRSGNSRLPQFSRETLHCHVPNGRVFSLFLSGGPERHQFCVIGSI